MGLWFLLLLVLGEGGLSYFCFVFFFLALGLAGGGVFLACEDFGKNVRQNLAQNTN